MILEHGDVGAKVENLQKLLTAHGHDLDPDGWFGDETEKAVIRFQRKNGLFVDGVAGPATFQALSHHLDLKALTEVDIKNSATRLNVDIAAIKAVTEVESRESGFLESGLPVILFERHVMYRQLPADTRSIQAASFPALVNSKPGGYVGGESEWRRLKRACSIDREAAIQSASWGLFQIMGFHWAHLGYASVSDFSEAMHRSEGDQLAAFVKFIQKDHRLHQALQQKDWATFARYYNGPAYRRNQYDTRMAAAYQRHNEMERIV
ncbi:N-acetylmuramidase domain-containing protein [Marinobacter oulmenensis]|uniref:Peptidoglycan-binding (PGRP) domain of peptidoglycan hydrolases-containing protein n=1 Tax=Marinobacter oulmenensis TaxID=643747 RepID=A0A840UDE6_9GAMM|nr:N-acetylmuramidase family protein [Marinobacter oulmenensis]MBB5320475.1 hypothetical protein [Marinobacter oulmenensis]